MRKRSHLSILVALFLTVGSVAPCVVESSEAGFDGAGIVRASDVSAGTDGDDQSQRKGGGFGRAISAPFRALGRLFGGGKKKPADGARKQTTAPRTEVAKADATPANTVVEKRQPEEPKGGQKKERREPKREQTSPAPEVRVVERPSAAAAASPAGDSRRGEGARVVRPSEGRVLPKQPRWIPVIEGLPKDPLSQGRALLQHGYPNEAISELSVAAVVGPDLVEANNLLGLAYDHTGQHRLAVEVYERALTVAPDNPQILANLGQSLYLAGNYIEALKRLKRAERLAPGAPSVVVNIALVQAGLGKYDDAYKNFARVLGEYDARLKTAELLELANRPDNAIKHYTAALKIQPNSPALLERLAELYERTGRQREAEATRRTLGNPPNKQKTATGGG